MPVMDNSGKRNANIVRLRKPRHWFRTFAAASVCILIGAVANVLNSFVSIFGFGGFFDLSGFGFLDDLDSGSIQDHSIWRWHILPQFTPEQNGQNAISGGQNAFEKLET